MKKQIRDKYLYEFITENKINLLDSLVIREIVKLNYEDDVSDYDIFMLKNKIKSLPITPKDECITKEGDVNTDDPLKGQVGGNHYRKYKIQPIEFITFMELSFCLGNVFKYVLRRNDKNGIQDVNKAVHYVDLHVKLER